MKSGGYVNKMLQNLGDRVYKINFDCIIQLIKQYLSQSLILLSVLLMFGNNYAFDIPQALELQIESRLNVTEIEFNLLYSVFALPNIGLSIGGGMMIDRIGGCWGIFTFSFMIWLSQFAIAFGGAYQKFYMMLVGRAIFGVASDMLLISIQKIIVQNMGNASAFALGIVMTVPELASALNAFLSPYLFYKSDSLTLPLIFGQSICLFSFICGCLLIAIIQMSKKNTVANQDDDDEEIENLYNNNEIDSSQYMRRSKWLQFINEPFIVILLICTLVLAVYVPFLDNVSKFYQERFGWTQNKAGRIVMLGYIIAAISSPLVGWVADNYRSQKAALIVISTSFFLISHLQFFLLKQGTQQYPNELSIFGLVTLGLGYAFYSAVLLPALQDTIKQEYLATGMGILGVAENICLAVVPLVSGIIYGEWNQEERMRAVDSVYLGAAAVAFMLSLRIYSHRGLKQEIQELQIQQKNLS